MSARTLRAKRIYISGPMTGVPQRNFPAFDAEAERLRSLGYEVVSPAEINREQDGDWHYFLRRDLSELLTCDAIALLEDWQNSSGAHLEMHVAHRVGMEILIAREIA